ncbi:MAG: ABC transporter permease [Cyclobacteriaceae bacterium]|nr:ABC transporter permease [Cyclobacteriaceae bacterium HetDA_MAG_MS6]
MFKNFFIIAIRNLRRNSLYSVTNIAGLAIGIVCSVLILLWVEDETSYDAFIPKVDRLYQVWVNAEFDNKINSWRSVPLPTYEAIKTADSNIKNSAVAGWGSDRLLAVGDKRIMKHGYFVSEEFLEMFEFPMLVGAAETVLDDPLSIVISEELATILFGNEDPLNQTIKFNNESSLKVTGIFKNVPGNSTFQFDYLVPWKHREATNPWVVRNKTNWGNYSFQIYVELYPSSTHQDAQKGISELLTENGQTDIPRQLFLHPMRKWRLHSSFENGKETTGRNDYVQLFSVIAIFILVIACINFMNLSTARSEKRAREVGIRKSLGSNKGLLISQFLAESIIIALIAYVIAILLAQLVLPAYNLLVDKELFIDFLSPAFWIRSVAIVLITGLVAGSYPAFYLASFNPLRTLKGAVTIGKSATTPRKVLVVLQFGFSILLMIATVVIYQQIDLVKNRDLGYDQENLISFTYTDDIEKNYDVLKQELLQSGMVKSVTRSNSPITEVYSNNFLGWPGKPETQKVIFTTVATEYDYAETMGIKMLMGRDFSKDFKSDTSSIIINKAALDLMQLPEPIIGTQLDLWGGKRKLIGVLDDVLMGSPYREVKPLFMILDPDWISFVTVRLHKGQGISSSLKSIQPIFEKFNPAYPFDYEFADVEFQKKFTTINMTRQLAILFSLLTIFITGLGLFGLASYTAEQRIKEIGIRKVLGATVLNLVTLISRDFSRLVIVAFVISAPLAWYLLDQYLERYPIRIGISWWIFPAIGLVALGFALLIVSNHAHRAATANPVKSLRNE